MRRVLRRETFIALRARRQAHQIASEIQNPELKVEPPPEPHVTQPVPVELDLEFDSDLASGQVHGWLVTPHPSVVRSAHETRQVIGTIAWAILTMALLAGFLVALLTLASVYFPPRRG